MKSTLRASSLGLLAVAAVAAVTLTGCRAETQNKFRRQVLDLANTTQYITVFSLSGQEIFRGTVDGKVTRADDTSAGQTSPGNGDYVYWFDKGGRYYQSNMQYIVTTDANRTGLESTPGAPAPAAK
ncbi:MAG TPA: hypothetical protein VHN99_00800 [Deinococcales bacterium]|nr:hypothetical protein [Deinococcales bacterium]